MSNDLKAQALALYSPPFKFEKGYVWDSKGHMVADDHQGQFNPSALRVRGWGRIVNLKGHEVRELEALQDAVGELIAKALTEFWEREIAKAKEAA